MLRMRRKSSRVLQRIEPRRPAALEHLTTNLGVGGSNPSGRATQSPGSQSEISSTAPRLLFGRLTQITKIALLCTSSDDWRGLRASGFLSQKKSVQPQHRGERMTADSSPEVQHATHMPDFSDWNPITQVEWRPNSPRSS